jgi:formimidoylglutamate deiminase
MHASLAHRRDDTLLDSWVATNAMAIDNVWAGGAHVVRGGRHVARDRIARAYAQATQRLVSA